MTGSGLSVKTRETKEVYKASGLDYLLDEQAGDQVA